MILSIFISSQLTKGLISRSWSSLSSLSISKMLSSFPTCFSFNLATDDYFPPRLLRKSFWTQNTSWHICWMYLFNLCTAKMESATATHQECQYHHYLQETPQMLTFQCCLWTVVYIWLFVCQMPLNELLVQALYT